MAPGERTPNFPVTHDGFEFRNRAGSGVGQQGVDKRSFRLPSVCIAVRGHPGYCQMSWRWFVSEDMTSELQPPRSDCVWDLVKRTIKRCIVYFLVPYRRIVSVVALKSWIFILFDSLLLQTLFSLWSDFHANAFRVLISLSCVHQLPRYTKSWSPVSVSACLISVPSMLCSGWMLVL